MARSEAAKKKQKPKRNRPIAKQRQNGVRGFEADGLAFHGSDYTEEFRQGKRLLQKSLQAGDGRAARAP